MFGRKKTVEPSSQPQPLPQAQAQPQVQSQPQAAMAPPPQPAAAPVGAAAQAGMPHNGAQQAAAPQAAAPPPLSAEEAQRRAVMVVRQSVAFAQMVTLLLRSPRHRQLTLADLEWVIVPPLLLGQFAIAEAKAQPDGPPTPVAMALWAAVTPEVDKRLSEDLANPIRLRPEEWRCGEILWLVDAVGEPRILAGLLKQVTETTFKGRELKVRQSGADGKVVVAVLAAQNAGATSAPAAA